MSLYDRPDLYERAFGDGREEAAFLSALLGPRRRVLVGACGAGRVSGELSRIGFDVVGFDLSAAMLRRACEEHRGEAGRAASASRHAVARLEAIPFADRSFDAAAVPLLGFSYVTGGSAVDASLRAFAGIVRDGGFLVLEVAVAHEPRRLQGIEERAVLPGGVEYSFRYLDLDRDEGGFAVLHTEIRVAVGGDSAARRAPLAVWRPAGIRGALQRCGFAEGARFFAPWDIASETDSPPADCLRAVVVSQLQA